MENIDRIVELEVDVDGIDVEELGVDVVSFVDEPAIEMNWVAFNKEQFVTPNAGEDEAEFIGRCMSALDSEFPDENQRLAVCYSYWEDEMMNDMTQEQRLVYQWAKECGEDITADFTQISLNQEGFSTISDIRDAIVGLDILGKMGIKKREQAQVRYQYTGPSAERGFCRAMMGLNKMYSAEDMQMLESRLSSINPGMGPDGRNRYSVFRWKGGVNCRHFWSRLLLYKPEGSNRVLMINEGPAQGDAGKSNNRNSPSPTGATANNASLRFSTIDDEKRIVAGPLMIANKMILRRDPDGSPYYVYFKADTIRKIQEKWSRNQAHNRTDVQHNGKVTETNTLLEQWIVEDPQFDKSRYYGFEPLSKGTWFGVYKVNDDQTWQDIKAGRLNGFSIEGSFTESAKQVQETEDDKKLRQILDVLKKVND